MREVENERVLIIFDWNPILLFLQQFVVHGSWVKGEEFSRKKSFIFISDLLMIDALKSIQRMDKKVASLLFLTTY